MSALTRLPLRELQECVGQGLLEELNQLLPVLDPEFIDGTLYNSKLLLEKIFIAFGGAERLRESQFREELLNHLEPSEISRIASSLGTVSTGDFQYQVRQVSKEGWKTPEASRTLLSGLGLPESLARQTRPKAPKFSIEQAPLRRHRPLLEYQASVFFQALERLKIPLSRFVIQMPTGSGKTRTAMEIISWMIVNSGCDVIWLAHSGELCAQAAESFTDAWRHLGDRSVCLARHFGESVDNNPEEAFDGPIFTVTSFQQMQRQVDSPERLPSFIRRERVGLIVVDEAHKVIAPTYKRVTRFLIGPQTACIGLTATPGRSVINLDENEELASFFFQRIVSFDTKGQDPIRYLRERKVLAQADYVPLRTNITFELTAPERQAAERFLDVPAGFLKRVGANSIRNAEIVKRLQSLEQGGRQILFFGCSVEHSRFICSVLSYLGIEAAHIDGTTPNESRQGAIERFRRGDLKVLCNFEVLSTGFDAPKTDVVFVSRPTASLVLYSQMVGRGLRGPAVGGTDSCMIVDVKDNIVGFSDISKTYSYFEEYWVN